MAEPDIQTNHFQYYFFKKEKMVPQSSANTKEAPDESRIITNDQLEFVLSLQKCEDNRLP